MKDLITICFLIYLCIKSHSAPRKPRLSLVEELFPTYFRQNIDGVPGTYTFSYGFSDSDTRNYQYRVEERYPNGSVIGIYEYGYPIGSHKAFKYIADENGYRVFQLTTPNANTNEMTTKPYRSPDQLIDSSITWARPANTNKKRPMNSQFDNMQVHTRPHELNMTGPPSSYVEY